MVLHVTKVSAAVLLAGVLAFGGTGCKKDKDGMGGKSADKSMKAKSGKTLYERLGGEPAITAVVNDFVARAAKDPKVNFTRKGHPNEWDASPANMAKLQKRLVEFIGENTGGPQKYQGKDMVAAHQGMEITEAEFNAAAAHLSASLDKFNVPAKEKAELLEIVGSTKGQMVGK